MIDVSQSGHYVGDCRDLLKQLPDACIQACVTSPPYYGLRDYGPKGQIGLEASPTEYVANLVDVFTEVHRVLRDDGTLWLNLGDSYSNIGKQGGYSGGKHARALHGKSQSSARAHGGRIAGLKPKDLIGIPWRVAFALQAAGWYLRSDIVWAKPNPMPEPVTDRPTRSHEYIFLLSKSERYFYDHEAIKDTAVADHAAGNKNGYRRDEQISRGGRGSDNAVIQYERRNKRDVWTVATQGYDGAHFATFPPALIEPCIIAGSRPGDVVLDPFFGSGTTGMVAEKHGRMWVGFDLNPEYEKLQRERTAQRSLILG